MPAFPFGFCGGENKACQVSHRVSPYEILTQILTACCYVNYHLKIITKTIWVEGLEDVSKWKYVNYNNLGLLHLAELPPKPRICPCNFCRMFSHATAPRRALTVHLSTLKYCTTVDGEELSEFGFLANCDRKLLM